jgi:hypothetical protein
MEYLALQRGTSLDSLNDAQLTRLVSMCSRVRRRTSPWDETARHVVARLYLIDLTHRLDWLRRQLRVIIARWPVC